MRLCIALTHKDHTSMQQVREMYIIHVHKKYRGPNHAWHQL